MSAADGPGELLVLQHDDVTGPDQLVPTLDARAPQQPWRLVALDREGVPRLTQDVRGLLVLGGPMGVADQDRFPWIAAELELLREAGAALRAGAPEAAIERLEDHRKRFPRGALVQEREALRVDALCAGGDAARGRRLAEDFLARWPRSPHRGRVERACRVMDPGDAGHSPL